MRQRLFDLMISTEQFKLISKSRDPFSRLEDFINSINKNTIKLYIVFTSNSEETNKNSLVTKNKVHSFDDYTKLKLPLYLICFLKLCEERSMSQSNDVHINSYNNLIKENKYLKQRKLNHMIIMWRQLPNNVFRILSFVTKGYHEFNLADERYFVTEVGGETAVKIVESWNRFNNFSDTDKLTTFTKAIMMMMV